MSSRSSELERLERAVAAFRREHALTYLKTLAGQPAEPVLDARARTRLTSEAAAELLLALRARGELDEAEDAALCAHLARATLEAAYQPARAATVTLLAREVSVEGDARSLGTLLGEWRASPRASQRERVLGASERSLASFAEALLTQRAHADAEVGALLGRLSATRHPDAGPLAGEAATSARTWLAETESLTREALAYTRRVLMLEGQGGLDLLWGALGQAFHGLFPRDGRLRRLASDFQPLGLRRLLAARGRAAVEHPGPLASPHVLVLAAPTDVRVSASAAEYGLASELATAEAVGRAAGIAHVSEALPLALRHAPAATVARTLGGLAVLRLAEPRFLRRVRDLTARESEAVARVALAYFLLDSRLAAVAVLARPLAGARALDEAAALVETALCAPAPRSAALLALRASPGAPFRAKSHATALAAALRERYDEDWYLNPRAGEPLAGALARGGALSVEALSEELGATRARGIAKLSELF